jgi:indole-3-glycerol phosphate synthase
MSSASAPHRDLLAPIVERKAREVARRLAHRGALARALEAMPLDEKRGSRAIAALSRPAGAPPRVIAEVKFESPSAGVIRATRPGEGVRVAEGYVQGGAAAVSVLADGPGFGGSPLGVRRVTRAIHAPVLFKEFVLDPVQVDLAYAMGASMVLLLVRILAPERLNALTEAARARGMEPVVEAADANELEVALATGARIVGVNARDLRTFRVDTAAAERCLEAIPQDRIAVFMSGIRERADLESVAATRADAVLVGEGLMRYERPGERLRTLLEGL